MGEDARSRFGEAPTEETPSETEISVTGTDGSLRWHGLCAGNDALRAEVKRLEDKNERQFKIIQDFTKRSET